MTTRHHIVNLALKFQGTPYIWGGSSPRLGFDCSGFVIWVLQVFDLLPSGDWTADNLSKMFPPTTTPEPGDLVCYGKDYVSHIGFFIGQVNSDASMVGANGGNSETVNETEALRRNAMVKIKPVSYRKDFTGYRSIGKDL